jgi:hypothetical protein
MAVTRGPRTRKNDEDVVLELEKGLLKQKANKPHGKGGGEESMSTAKRA